MDCCVPERGRALACTPATRYMSPLWVPPTWVRLARLGVLSSKGSDCATTSSVDVMFTARRNARFGARKKEAAGSRPLSRLKIPVSHQDNPEGQATAGGRTVPLPREAWQQTRRWPGAALRMYVRQWTPCRLPKLKAAA